MEKLETNLRELRLSKGMTQEELAEKVGVVRQTIVYIEKGVYMPSLGLAWRIAKIFNLPIEKVFKLKS